MKPGKVLMAMSGGLDSSMAAIMLIEKGYDVIGITMKTWDNPSGGLSSKETACCSLDSVNDARFIAVTMGFPHYVIDLREEFNNYIISDFISQYMRGRTPNPCVLCNTYIKWAALLKRADQLGCRYIATGHYARVRQEKHRYVLSKGLDENKDQSYMLWGLTQQMLKRTLFPLGEHSKSFIRRKALETGFESIAKKRESYEICFVPGDDYRSFLKEHIPGLEQKVNGGAFTDTAGNIMGTHCGFPFFTIGQRKGLNIPMEEPMYVKHINADTNTIVLGKKHEIFSKSFMISDFNYIKFESVPENLPLVVKIRYKDKGYKASFQKDGSLIKVMLNDEAMAVTPGQSAVIYHGEDVVGGGFIDSAVAG